MVSRKITITNSQGFHMRPATLFTKKMAGFSSEISIIYNNKKIPAISIMAIIAAAIKCGSEVEIECTGSDEEVALEAAIQMIESGFGEE